MAVTQTWRAESPLPSTGPSRSTLNWAAQTCEALQEWLPPREPEPPIVLRPELSLAEFCRAAWHVVEPATVYVPNWHLDAISEHLQAVSEGQIRNLLINMPPRHEKSLQVAVFWPCWEWSWRPTTRWLFSSYALSLSIRDSVSCRRLIESPWYRERWAAVYKLTSDQNQKTRFENDKRGLRLATSVGGSATGEGGDRVVVDDPHNVNEAESDIIRQGVLEWWGQVMSTRLNDPKTGAKVIVMQRVHQSDLSGYVLEQGGYEHLCLPAEFEGKKFVSGWVPTGREEPTEDPRRAVGELLWPEHFGRPEIDSLKRSLGSYGAAGQLQQRPAPAGGGLFRREYFRRYEDAGEFWRLHRAARTDSFRKSDCWLLQTVDLAASEKTTADWTVIDTYAVTPRKDLLLLDVVRERMEAPVAKRRIAENFRRWAPTVLAVERNGLGMPIVQDLIGEGLPVRAVWAARDKVTRATGAALRYEAGTIFHPQAAPWLGDREKELELFPNADNDDQVDTTSTAALVVAAEVGVFGEFGQGFHVALDPVQFRYDLPFTGGWAFAPVPAFALVQLQEDGEMTVLWGAAGEPSLGLYEFGRTVKEWLARNILDPARKFEAAVKIQHFGPEEHLGGDRSREDVRPVLYQPQERHKEREPGRWKIIEEDALRFPLAQSRASEAQWENAVRQYLRRTLGGRPALNVDPSAVAVIEALGGGYRRAQSLTTGIAGERLEENASAAVARALGLAVYHTNPIDPERRELVGAGPRLERRQTGMGGRARSGM